jgi:hypothetical protein
MSASASASACSVATSHVAFDLIGSFATAFFVVGIMFFLLIGSIVVFASCIIIYKFLEEKLFKNYWLAYEIPSSNSSKFPCLLSRLILLSRLMLLLPMPSRLMLLLPMPSRLMLLLPMPSRLKFL